MSTDNLLTKISVVLPVYINKPSSIPMTMDCLSSIRNTKIPFELIIIEAETDYFREYADIHIYEKKRTNVTISTDKGFRISNGEYVVFIGNDVKVCENWLEYMLDCFDKRKDCGIASLGNNEHNDEIKNEIIEEVFFSVCMMKKEDAWLDTNYGVIFSDTDLIFRLYTQGKKFYKNLNGYITHNAHATLGEYGGDFNEYERSRDYFINKYASFKNDDFFKKLSGIKEN